MEVMRLDICAGSTLSRVYVSFWCSPGSQPSPSRQVPDRLQSGQMRSPGQPLMKSCQHKRQRRRFCVCSRSDSGFLLESSEWVITHPACRASILLSRYSWVNAFADSEKAERSGRWVTDLQVLGHGFWVPASQTCSMARHRNWMPELRVVELGICGAEVGSSGFFSVG